MAGPQKVFPLKSGGRLQVARQPAGQRRLHGVRINFNRSYLVAFKAMKGAQAAPSGNFSTYQGHTSLTALAARPLYRGERRLRLGHA